MSTNEGHSSEPEESDGPRGERSKNHSTRGESRPRGTPSRTLDGESTSPDSRLARQQESIVALGRLALGNATLDELLEETTVRVACALDVELVKVLQVVSGGEELLLRAGIGWDDGIVGFARLGTGLDSQAGFTLRTDGAVVVLDLATEERFHGPPLLSAHGVVSGMSVIIRPPDGPWGVLGAHTRARRTFSALDVHFLESMANILADAIARSRVEDQLRRRAREMSLLFRITTSDTTSLPEALRTCIEAVCEITGWPIGHAFVLAPDGRSMRPSSIWRIEDEERARDFRERTEASSFLPGEGFVGTIWERREPVGLSDVGHGDGSPERRLSGATEIRGAFGFPVIVGDEVAAVLEFFSHAVISKDDLPLDVVQTLGSQVGRVLERNRSVESRRVGAERLALALEAGGLATWDWDMVRDVTAWNDQHFRLLGYAPGEVTPSWEAWFARLHPDDRPRTDETFLRAREDRVAYDCEYRVLRPNGEVVWVEARGRFSYDEQGVATRMYGVILDVTRRRSMEARLLEADRRKNTFLSTLGHELRNPLAAVVNGIHLVERMDPGEAVRAACAMMTRQTRQMARLLDDLLDVGRIERGAIHLDRETLRVRESLERAVETARTVIDARGHHLSVSVEPPDLAVRVDPNRFEQILVNLLMNAARHTDHPGRIDVRCRETADGAAISVQDDGVGLSESEMRDIFEPFFQSRKGKGGLGIGLSLVRKLTELHGGVVRVESDGAGRGSTFTVTFPDVVESPRMQRPRVRSVDGAAPPSFRILAVDDHEDSLTALESLLVARYVVETARTGEEALAKAPRFRPHAILLDIGLPGMNGIEVARALAGAPELARTLWIAMTGFGDSATELEVVEAGFDEHLLKPIDVGALEELLGRLSREVDSAE